MKYTKKLRRPKSNQTQFGAGRTRTVALLISSGTPLADVQTVNILETFRDKKDPFQVLADQLGIPVEDLKKKLSP